MVKAKETHVKNEKRILRGHDLWNTVVGDFKDFLVPPVVSPLGPSDLVARSLENEDVLDMWALGESSIDNGFVGDCLSTTPTLIGGDDDAGLAVLNAIAEGSSGETGKDN